MGGSVSAGQLPRRPRAHIGSGNFVVSRAGLIRRSGLTFQACQHIPRAKSQRSQVTHGHTLTLLEQRENERLFRRSSAGLAAPFRASEDLSQTRRDFRSLVRRGIPDTALTADCFAYLDGIQAQSAESHASRSGILGQH